MKIKLSMKQKQMLGVGIVIIGVLSGVYWKFFWAPISKRIDDARNALESTTRKIQKAQRQAARLPQLEKELERLNAQAAEAEKRLPREKGIPNILVTVSKLAAKHNVTIRTFSPGGVSKKQFFTALQYPMSLSGSYHNIGKFLAAIALEERIYNVVNVTYGGITGNGELPITMTLVSYVYKG